MSVCESPFAAIERARNRVSSERAAHRFGVRGLYHRLVNSDAYPLASHDAQWWVDTVLRRARRLSEKEKTPFGRFFEYRRGHLAARVALPIGWRMLQRFVVRLLSRPPQVPSRE